MSSRKDWKTVSIRKNLLKALQNIADSTGQTRSELIHQVLWAYAKLKGEV